MTIQRVAIIGGGFSGAMLAARLAERGVASTLIDAGGDFGLGVAYSTPFDGHLLNVRSARMSAIDGDHDHFVRWLKANYPERAEPDDFAPRRLYGLYVKDRLAEVEAAHPGLIHRFTGRAIAIDGTTVALSDGRTVAADAVVLATGNPAPRTASGQGRVIGDPWGKGALEVIEPDDDIVIIGTGLTMVDMVLWLDGRGWRGRATALSRRGLLPRSHAARPDAVIAPTPQLTTGPASGRLAEARRVSETEGWRAVMEGLRGRTAELWSQADATTRARLLRHLRPWWDVHRHRIADRLGAAVDGLIASGRLRVLAGRVRSIDSGPKDVRVVWSPRPGQGLADDPVRGRWLIDCTGPGHDPARDPLTGPLIASGRARMDVLKLGLDLDGAGRVLDASGRADPRLFVLGPPARAAFWETIAVPDIRKRIEDVVQALTPRA